MSGFFVGARGEMDDMGKFRKDQQNRSSWPDLFRPSTSCSLNEFQDVDGRDKPGHDGCKYYWLRRRDSEFLLLPGRHLEVAGFAGTGRLVAGLVLLGGFVLPLVFARLRRLAAISAWRFP